MVFLVRSASLEDDVARYARLRDEAELALVQHVLLWLELDVDHLGQVLSLLLVARHWGHQQALRHLPQRQGLSFE